MNEKDDPMSLVDAEMSRLKSLVRVTERERDAAQNALSAAQAEVTRLTDVLAEIRDIAASDRSDVVIACTVGAWAQEALAVQPAADPQLPPHGEG